MPQFGLIGKPLTHSFSKAYFEKKFQDLGLSDHQYANYELDTLEALPALIAGNSSLKGLNVTIPYKESVLPFLDELSPEARKIGAVNCICIEDGRLVGYNTDVYGFSQSIKPFLDPRHERALILGTGGSSKAVAYALESVGVEVYYVSSSGKQGSKIFSYGQLNDRIFESFKLIVNTSPVGMFPNTQLAPEIPYQYLTKDHLCYDLIYNPSETLFLEISRKHGATIMNGLSMLQLQAEKSWEIWKR